MHSALTSNAVERVGAGGVLTHSLPPRAVAVGVPAHIINRRGSFHYIEYLNMEEDAARTESLRAAEERPTTTCPAARVVMTLN